MKLILSAILVMLLSTSAYAESLEVVSIDKGFQHAVLKDTFSGQSFSVRLGDMVSDCRVEGITRDFVTVSKLQNGTLLLVRLPVKEHYGKKPSSALKR
jgi:hypothetical protein